MLVPDLYRINSTRQEAEKYIFSVSILPECPVYRGHFPGEPITPGVCTLQMVRECAQSVLGRSMFLGEIKVCRYIKLVTPEVLPEGVVTLSLTPGEGDAYLLVASLTDPQGIEYMSLKAVLNG